jgi:hypothetical protein
MGRLELGLGLEVLGFRVVPPSRENRKGEGFKIEQVFLPY